MADSGATKGRAVSLAVRREKAKRRVADLTPVSAEIEAGGASSLPVIAAGLNQRGIPTAQSGRWSAVQVKRVLERVP